MPADWEGLSAGKVGEGPAIIRAVRNLVFVFNAGPAAFWASLAAFLDVAAIDVERLAVVQLDDNRAGAVAFGAYLNCFIGGVAHPVHSPSEAWQRNASSSNIQSPWRLTKLASCS